MQWRMAWESVLSTVVCCCLFHDLTWKHSLRMDVRFGVEENMTCLPYTSCVSGSSGKYRSSHLHRVLSVFRVAQSSFPLPSFLQHSQGVNVRLLVRLTPATQWRKKGAGLWVKQAYLQVKTLVLAKEESKAEFRGESCFLFLFFQFYQFIATNPSPSTLMHACSVMEPNGLQPTRLLCPRIFPGKNTGVGCHFLLHVFVFFFFLTSIILIKFGKAYGESD